MNRLSIKHIIQIFFFVSLLFITILVYYRCNPLDNHWFPQCIVKQLTGFSCPGCGVQRAIHSFLNGRFGEALSYNYFFVISLPYAASVGIAYVLQKLHKCRRISEFLEHCLFARVYVCCFFVWFVIRNIFGI